MKRSSERGSAMLVAMILMAALLAGAAVLVSLQLGSNRNTELTKTGISALYCAEAGLTATRQTVAQNSDTWGTYLGLPKTLSTSEPAWLANISHDVDGDTSNDPDWRVTLEDNNDEIPASGENPNADVDSRIYIVSQCLRYPDMPREVRELITFTTVTHCYSAQKGGCGGNGNMNSAP
ncbi:MAG TPA: hypothetical protein VFV99_27840 [Kofleriaceae bacterium]|nr:hypothetical protein [Kofleriaceae bacterium]